ncbi:Hypothetical protein PHPALM_36357 [Phytophthora palmivora]|uniref:Jacalin-type lectin domain-containing protein n=1 Tax=Phytophthora palmivora TaxID=4796 RepID=A0A2P4X045_9STRA|nr:Hypothetical protein PHPALM_36357 [Phytophthora palmivora]
MRLLPLVLTSVVSLVSVSNEITLAAKTPMRADIIHDTTVRGQNGGELITRDLASDETVLEERATKRRRRRKKKSKNDKGNEEEGEELPPGVYEGEEFGGPHGNEFTDLDMVKSGQKVVSVSIRSHERVDAVALDIVLPTGEKNTLYHGGNGGQMNTTALAEGEHIITMEAHWGKQKGHTRIKYIKFTTTKGNVIQGGRPTGSIGVDNADAGYQLGGFYGRSGDEVDKLGAIWTSIQPMV